MKRAISLIMSLVFIAGVAGLADARMGMKRSMEQMVVKQIEGEVKAVNEKERTITVEGMRGLVTVMCDDYKTSVRMAKEPRTCFDIKKGDKVTVTFDVDQSGNRAKVVSIEPPKEEKEKKEQ